MNKSNLTATVKQHLLDRYAEGQRFTQFDLRHLAKQIGRDNKAITDVLRSLESKGAIIDTGDTLSNPNGGTDTHIYMLADASKITFAKTQEQLQREAAARHARMIASCNNLQRVLDTITRARLAHA